MNDLSSYKTSELLRELSRRHNEENKEDQPTRYCDDCSHFIYWMKGRDVPDDYNACRLKHVMKFRAGDPWSGLDDEDWGYYRKNCRDFTPREKP